MAALENYKSSFGMQLKSPVTFNPSLDTMLLGGEGIECFKPYNPKMKKQAQVLRYLAMYPPTVPIPGDEAPIVRALTLVTDVVSQFSNLKELVFIKGSADSTWEAMWPSYLIAHRGFNKWVSYRCPPGVMRFPMLCMTLEELKLRVAAREML